MSGRQIQYTLYESLDETNWTTWHTSVEDARERATCCLDRLYFFDPFILFNNSPSSNTSRKNEKSNNSDIQIVTLLGRGKHAIESQLIIVSCDQRTNNANGKKDQTQSGGDQINGIELKGSTSLCKDWHIKLWIDNGKDGKEDVDQNESKTGNGQNKLRLCLSYSVEFKDEKSCIDKFILKKWRPYFEVEGQNMLKRWKAYTAGRVCIQYAKPSACDMIQKWYNFLFSSAFCSFFRSSPIPHNESADLLQKEMNSIKQLKFNELSNKAMQSNKVAVTTMFTLVPFVPTNDFTPSNKQELVAIVKWCIKEKRRIRVLGAAHSLVANFATDGVFVRMTKLNKILDYDPSKKLLKAEAGLTVCAAADFLEEKGFTLPIYGSIDLQTLGGIIATGTHGSTLERSAVFGNYVEELEFINGKGHLVHLKASLKKDVLHMRAAKAAMGCLGIVTQMTLKIIPDFGLKAKRIWYDGDPGDPVLAHKIKKLAYHYFHIYGLWLPLKNRVLLCCLKKMPLDKQQKQQKEANENKGSNLTRQEPIKKSKWDVTKENVKGCITPHNCWGAHTAYDAEKRIESCCISGSTLPNRIFQSTLSTCCPSLAREIEDVSMDAIARVFEDEYTGCGNARNMQKSNKTSVGFLTNLAPKLHIRGVIQDLIDEATFQEFAVDMKNMRQTFSSISKIVKKHEYLELNEPFFCFRFGGKDDLLLSGSSGRDCMWIEWQAYRKNPLALKLFREVEDHLLGKMGATCHWSKSSQRENEDPLNFSRLSYFPQENVDLFNSIRKEMDPHRLFASTII